MDNATIAQTDIELPSSVPSERVVLGIVIEDGKLLSDILDTGLGADDFSLTDHARLFKAILDLRQQNAPIDYVTVAEKLGDRAEDVALIAQVTRGAVVAKSHATYHARKVREKAARRAVIKHSEWLQGAAADPSEPLELLIHGAIEKLQAVQL